MGKKTDKEEFFRAILENRTICLELMDYRRAYRGLTYGVEKAFQIMAVRNSTEWTLGDWLTEKQVNEILADERCIEVNIASVGKRRS